MFKQNILVSTIMKVAKMLIICTILQATVAHAQSVITEDTMKELYNMNPPKAQKIPHTITIHGENIIDNYFWLRDTKWPKVENSDILNYLNKENDYSKTFMQQHQSDYDKLYEELIGRIQLEDTSVPIKKDNYEYYLRTENTSEHPIYCRKLYLGNNEGISKTPNHKEVTAKEEIILDVNVLAKNTPYFSLDEISVSRDHTKLLYSADLTGSDRYTVKIKDLKTGKLYPDTIENTLGSVIWNKNGTGFFYSKLSDNWRTEEIYFHRLGDTQKQDRLLYKEKDPLFMVSLDISSSKKYLFIIAESKNTTEIQAVNLDEDSLEPTLIQARREDHLYTIDHHADSFYILTNDKGKNFRLVSTLVTKPEESHWQELIPHDPKVYLCDFSLYQRHLALSSREEGLVKINVINLNNFADKEVIRFPDPSYQASQIFTTFDAKGVRIQYSSLVSPSSILEYDFETKVLKTLKVAKIPSGYDKTLYTSERIFATSPDGTQVPISLVYKKSLFKKDSKNPLYLYGYGSYGIAISASFRHTILSLLDRGYIYAIAHVRGGDDMGYEWYESAKFLTKRNTFDDFISVTKHLIKENYTSMGNITISGGSAGGMLIGVSINEHPELFKTAVADVPFVDVLNTMLDDTLPLTPGEFKEWGNPKDPQYFKYIKSYSPYDNVKAQKYPALYVTAGINDPRVTYWEPAKWVAKLRDMKTDNHLLLFDINMDAGHAGASGRFGSMKDMAKEYLFIFAEQGLLKN